MQYFVWKTWAFTKWCLDTGGDNDAVFKGVLVLVFFGVCMCVCVCACLCVFFPCSLRDHLKETMGTEEQLRPLCCLREKQQRAGLMAAAAPHRDHRGSTELCSVWQRPGLSEWHGAVSDEGQLVVMERVCTRGKLSTGIGCLGQRLWH